MDFGFTDDQRQIQRTARELLAERARPERVREHAEAGRTDAALWRELRELGAGETTGALGVAVDGTAELVIGAPEAQVIVLIEEDRTARVLAAEEAEVTPIASIDPTRSTARVSAGDDAGEPLSGDVPGGIDRALVAISSELVGVCDRAVEMTIAYVKERKQFGV